MHPYQWPRSSFNCRWQLQSLRNGQEQPLLWLPSACFAYPSYWQASKSIADWGRVCLFGRPSEAAVLVVICPPPCLPGSHQDHNWEGGSVVQGRAKRDSTPITRFYLFALGETAAFSTEGNFLGLAVPCWDQWSVCTMARISCSLARLSPPRGWEVGTHLGLPEWSAPWVQCSWS